MRTSSYVLLVLLCGCVADPVADEEFERDSARPDVGLDAEPDAASDAEPDAATDAEPEPDAAPDAEPDGGLPEIECTVTFTSAAGVVDWTQLERYADGLLVHRARDGTRGTDWVRKYAYDDGGRLVSKTLTWASGDVGQDYSAVFDAAGRFVSERSRGFDNYDRTYEWEGARLISKTDRQADGDVSVVENYEHDDQDRILRALVWFANQRPAELVRDFTYDALGRLVRMEWHYLENEDLAGRVTRSYDPDGRPLEVAYFDSDGVFVDGVVYTYEAGRLVEGLWTSAVYSDYRQTYVYEGALLRRVEIGEPGEVPITVVYGDTCPLTEPTEFE